MSQKYLLSIQGQSEIHPDFNNYYQSYLKEASLRNINLEKKYVKIEYDELNTLNSNEYARCVYFPKPHIIVNKKEIFYNQNSEMKELILFHELTHCLLLKPHVNDKNYHIMNERSSDNLIYMYRLYRSDMLNRLFDSNTYSNQDYFNKFLGDYFIHMQNNFIIFLLLAIALLFLKDFLNKKGKL